MSGIAIFVGVLWTWPVIFLAGSFIGWFLGIRMGWLGRRMKESTKIPVVLRRGTSEDAPVSVRVHPQERWTESDSDGDTLRSIPVPAFFPKKSLTVDFTSLQSASVGAKK